ncbi:YunG family protein [Falsiroseomonas sp.]|uniref:YunG family protein n=1 Tax=Falsiroseomonas sp. TaxID=2870721 RepID=UPI003F70E182
MLLSPPGFARLIRACWSIRTASTFRADNPAHGQCSVTALLAQDVLGGTLARTRIGEAWHFYNIIEGVRFDFTAEQFERPLAYEDRPATRAEAWADTTPGQYRALAEAFRDAGSWRPGTCLRR